MRSDATTVEAYLDELPPDRREAIEAVRAVMLDHLPDGYVESISWGVISYEVPLDVCPDTYNGKPLMYAGLAAQKRYLVIYLMNVFVDPDLRARLVHGFEDAGKKLDIGGSCIRFTRLENLALDVIGEMVGATPLDEFVAIHETRNQR